MKDMAMELHPTLWRTCRVLSGETRLKLLRLIIATPGKTVSRLAEETGIGLSRASQELRRLQSRGLVQTVRKGSFVHYLPDPDPQVPDAKPLLLAMKATFAHGTPSQTQPTIAIARALSHPRRILILRELRDGPRNIPMLQTNLPISAAALFRHLRALQQGGLVQCKTSVFQISRNAHPLAKCLLDLIRTQKVPKPN